jgi:hypothetical protein
MKVPCSVRYGDETFQSGRQVETTEVTCSRCEHVEVSYGTSDKSMKRCLVMLRDNCPFAETNYYTCDEAEGDD